MRYERSLAIAERLKRILTLVRKGTHSSQTVAMKLGVSEQTIYRDILFLKRQGHRIRSIKNSNRWAYILDEGDNRKCQP